MSRSRSPEKLRSIASAATELFGQLGYRRTQMADVARSAGLSTGAIYTYVESKEALFHLVFAAGFGQMAEGLPALPLKTPDPTETLQLIRKGLRELGATPLMRAALTVDEAQDIRGELTAIIVERCQVVERLWTILAVIERSAPDLPDLDHMYYQRGRKGHIHQLEQYLQLRATSGQLRATEDVGVAAQMMTESIAWFSWHRLEDRDAARFDPDRARTTLIQFICNALIEPP